MRKGSFNIFLFLINFIFATTFDFYQGFIYDDNVYRFSPIDLDLFKKGKKDKDYKTTDDLINETGLKLNFYKGIFRFSFKTKYKGYLQNRKKSCQEYRVNIGFSKINIGYSFLPNYYLRNFYKKPCIYTEHTIFSEIKLANFGIRIKNEINFYNKDFKYYNSNAFSTLLKYERDINTSYQISGRLTLTKNWVIERLKENDPDISYFQIGNQARFRKRGEVWELLLILEIKRRNYLTKIALTHKKRVDYIYSFSLEMPIKFKRDLHLVLGYEREKRSCDIPYYEKYEDIKNYLKNIFYLRLEKGGRL